VPQTFVVSTPEVVKEEAALELPVCERAKRIELHLHYAYTTWLRPQASGLLFAALTSLKIDGYVHMQGSDLTALVSMQCPCLRDLDLFITLIAIFDVSIHSNSLHRLKLNVLETRHLEISAPSLEELVISNPPMEAQISAPKLVKVAWDYHYDPHLIRFVVGRRLQLLRTSTQALSLAMQFDQVDDLNLSVNLDFHDAARYGSFLNETNKLPKCKSFCIFLWWGHHALLPVMLHLLRSCNDTKKLQVHLCGSSPQPVMHSCLPSCLCRSEESRKIDGIDLNSLEVAEISGFSGSHEQMELVEFLSNNAGVLKRLLINDEFCSMPKEVREKVCSMCHPNVEVGFFVLCKGRQVLVD